VKGVKGVVRMGTAGAYERGRSSILRSFNAKSLKKRLKEKGKEGTQVIDLR